MNLRVPQKTGNFMSRRTTIKFKKKKIVLHGVNSHNIVRVINSRRKGWTGQVARNRITRNAYHISVVKFQGKKQGGKPRCRRKNNTIWIVEKWEGRWEWIELGQNRIQWQDFVNTVMELRVPRNGKFLHRLTDCKRFKEDSVMMLQIAVFVSFQCHRAA
jgi:hypothetical protein